MEKIILDLETLVLAIKECGVSFKELKEAIKLIYPEKNIKQILITNQIWEELEKAREKEILEKLEKEITEDYLEYIELDKDKDIVNFCIEQGISFFSIDVRMNYKYFYKQEDKTYNRINRYEIKEILKLSKEIIGIKKSNLHVYLKKLFKSKQIDVLEYIAKSGKEQLQIILKYLVEEKEINKDLKKNICYALVKYKEGEIGIKDLKRSLSRIEEYKLVNLNFEESLEEIHAEIIEKFLKEKNIESLEELVRKNTFETKEAIIEKIKKYYESKIGG